MVQATHFGEGSLSRFRSLSRSPPVSREEGPLSSPREGAGGGARSVRELGGGVRALSLLTGSSRALGRSRGLLGGIAAQTQQRAPQTQHHNQTLYSHCIEAQVRKENQLTSLGDRGR